MKEVNYDGKTKMLRGFPRIRKLGAINRNGEMTPFVHKGRLMRAELIDPNHGLNRNSEDTVICIRDVGTNEIVSYVAEGCNYPAAYVENDVVYITTTVMDHYDTVRIFKSDDLVHWEYWDLFTNPGWHYVNTGLCQGLVHFWWQ